MVYWDTSAIVKLYVTEADSPYFLRLATTGGQTVSSTIVTAETLCALHRKEAGGEMEPGAAALAFDKLRADITAGRIRIQPYDDAVLAHAETLVRLAYQRTQPTPIRSLDAIHLASALASGAASVVSTDARLREAAALVGLPLLPERR